MYSDTVSFCHFQGIAIYTTIASVTFNCILKVSKKELCHLALNLLNIAESKERKIHFCSSGYGSSRTCCGWPLNFFFVIDEGKNGISWFVSITRVNVIIFILLLPPLSSSSLWSLSLFSKGSFTASFLSLKLVCSGSVLSGFIWRRQCLVITLTL